MSFTFLLHSTSTLFNAFAHRELQVLELVVIPAEVCGNLMLLHQVGYGNRINSGARKWLIKVITLVVNSCNLMKCTENCSTLLRTAHRKLQVFELVVVATEVCGHFVLLRQVGY